MALSLCSCPVYFFRVVSRVCCALPAVCEAGLLDRYVQIVTMPWASSRTYKITVCAVCYSMFVILCYIFMLLMLCLLCMSYLCYVCHVILCLLWFMFMLCMLCCTMFVISLYNVMFLWWLYYVYILLCYVFCVLMLYVGSVMLFTFMPCYVCCVLRWLCYVVLCCYVVMLCCVVICCYVVLCCMLLCCVVMLWYVVMLCYVNRSFSFSSYLACRKSCLPHKDQWRPFTQVFVENIISAPILTKLRNGRVVLIPFLIYVITTIYRLSTVRS